MLQKTGERLASRILTKKILGYKNRNRHLSGSEESGRQLDTRIKIFGVAGRKQSPRLKTVAGNPCTGRATMGAVKTTKMKAVTVSRCADEEQNQGYRLSKWHSLIYLLIHKAILAYKQTIIRIQLECFMKSLCVFSFVLFLTGCGVQSIPQARNAVDASEAEILNQYQRRSDLIPNLVNTVKGYAKQEEKVLVGVIEARSHATQIKLDSSNIDSVRKFQAAQGQVSQALGRLMVVTENYPQLKSNENFLALQAQLEGTENRITVARKRHIDNIQAFNNEISVPPSSFTNSIFYHYAKLPQWTVENPSQIEKSPKVEF